MKEQSDGHFPHAERIRVVVDNLNIHTPSGTRNASMRKCGMGNRTECASGDGESEPFPLAVRNLARELYANATLFDVRPHGICKLETI